MKDSIKSKIEMFTNLGCVKSAKSWFIGLTPMQKAVAIGILVGLGWGTLAYFCTVGKVSAVVAGGVVSPGPAITSAQAFWNAVVAGTLAGGLAAYVTHSHYKASTAPIVEDTFEV